MAPQLYTTGMTDLVQALRGELVAIESDIAEFEAEAAKLRARQQRTLDKAEKVRALLALYADEAAAGAQPALVTEATVAPAPVDAFQHADQVSEQAIPSQHAGGSLGSPILRRFGRGLPPITG